MAYKGSLMVNDEVLLKGFKMCKDLGALAQVHAENGDAVAEGQSRMIKLGITGPEGHALSRPSMVSTQKYICKYCKACCYLILFLVYIMLPFPSPVPQIYFLFCSLLSVLRSDISSI
jgi:hypothetical protein